MQRRILYEQGSVSTRHRHPWKTEMLYFAWYKIFSMFLFNFFNFNKEYMRCYLSQG